MRSILILTVILLVQFTVAAESRFQKLFGDTLADNLVEILKTYDGGYLMAGNIDLNDQSPDRCDVGLYFTNRFGDLSYSLRIGDNQRNVLKGAYQHANHALTIYGVTYGSPNDASHTEIFVVQLDEFGTPLWSSCFGTYGDDQVGGLYGYPDGSCVVVGKSAADGSALIFKIDNIGHLSWSHVMTVTGFESFFNSITPTMDGYFIVAGGVLKDSVISGNSTYPRYNDLLAKFDLNGDLVWSKTYGTTPGSFISNSVAFDPAGGFIVTGSYSQTASSAADVQLFKLDPSGNEQWRWEYQKADHETPNGLLLLPSNKIAIVGNITQGGDQQGFILVTDSTGHLDYDYHYGTGSAYDIIDGIDGGIAIAGSSDQYTSSLDGHMLKTDVSGITGCNETAVNFTSGIPAVSHAATLEGHATPVFLNEDYLTFLTTTYANQFGQLCSFIGVNEQQFSASFSIFPNPGSESISINNPLPEKINGEILDANGRILENFALTSLSNTKIPTNQLSAGMYTVRIFNDTFQQHLRWIKQ